MQIGLPDSAMSLLMTSFFHFVSTELLHCSAAESTDMQWRPSLHVDHHTEGDGNHRKYNPSTDKTADTIDTVEIDTIIFIHLYAKLPNPIHRQQTSGVSCRI
jgi:hypothetical protein